MGDLSSGTGKVVENVVVVEKQAHGLPDNAKEEPKYHISNHRAMVPLFYHVCQVHQRNLHHDTKKSPASKHMTRNTNDNLAKNGNVKKINTVTEATNQHDEKIGKIYFISDSPT